MTPTRSNVVLLDVKPPMMRRPLRREVQAGLTPREALAAVFRSVPQSAEERRIWAQLKTETAGQHDYLVQAADGHLIKIDPDRPTLREIALPREVRTPEGKVETVLVVLCDVQAYARVGRAEPGRG